MNEHANIQLSGAAKLAQWTQLRLDEVEIVYTTNATAAAKKWKTLEANTARAADRATLARQVILQAFDEAEKHDFLVPLAGAITKLERDRYGRAEADISELMTAIGPGEMQALTDRAAGLLDFAIVPQLLSTGHASAYVSAGNAIIGTAFLVAPDLVLTSAHVALDTGANGKFLSKRLKPNLKFTFKPDMRVQPPAPVVRAALGSSPVAEAPPHGEPPNKLNRALNAAAAQHLDFALVRLSSQVTHVPPIDIKEPAAAEEHRKCTVIGYAGGTAIKLDIDLVTRVHQASARLLHLANTVAGMSGSCCVGPSGMPVGLHEGGFYKLDANGNVVLNANQQVMVENNRAVCLSNIRDVLRAMDPDPLLAKPRTAGGGILNPALVVAWQRAGERLAGVGLVAAWNDLVAHALGVAIADIGATQSFHPWFTRKVIEDWIDARRTNTADRVAFINGDRGTGKSFSIHILAAKLDDPVRDLVVLTATQTSAWSWREAVTNLPRGTHGDPALRTDVGAVKYEDIGSIIAGLRDYGGIDRTLGNEPLFVAIDFEDARDLKLEGPPWLEFIKQLAMQPWIRLMIIGLADGERRTLDKIFENEAGTASMFSVQIDLTHVDRAELTLFLRALYGDQGRPANNAQINADLKAWTAQTWLRARRPELQTAEAVLFALAARRQILASAAAEPARGGN